jgi:hypothetical protein
MPLIKTSRPSRLQVFRALLWAEAAPRYRVLRIIVGFMLFVSLSRLFIYLNEVSFELKLTTDMGMDNSLKSLALAGIIYCALSHEIKGFSLRQSWQSMGLPVRTHWLILPSMVYQLGVALLLGTLWGLYRISDGFDEPFVQPLSLLVMLSAQGQAAMFWCSAVGLARGLAVYGMGLAVALAAGFLARNVGPFSPDINFAVVLVAGGWIWSCVAARATRGGPAPHFDVWRLPGAASLRDWNLARAARKTSFTSPFWAQVWFEWRRSASWLVILVAVVAVLMLLIDVPYTLAEGRSLFEHDPDEEEGGWRLLFGAAPLIVIPVFWFAHITVTRPYRRFVFTRPTTAKRVGSAKLLTVLLAIIVMNMIETTIGLLAAALLPPGAANLDPAHAFSIFDSIFSYASLIYGMFLILAYGPMLFVIFFLYALSASLPLWRHGDTTVFEPDMEPMAFFVGFFIFLLIGLLLITAMGNILKRKLDFRDYPFPWELLATLAALVTAVSYAAFEHYQGEGILGRTAFIYAGPVLLALATFRYGHRAGILTAGQRNAVLALFAGLFLIGMFKAQASPDMSMEDQVITLGYWIVLAVSSIVLYPILIGGQRQEPEKFSSPGKPHWILLVLFPVLWVAFHLLGENLSDEEKHV